MRTSLELKQLAIPAQRTADAGIVFALTAHQHRHIGHRHVPRSVAAQTGGAARAAVGRTGSTAAARAAGSRRAGCRTARPAGLLGRIVLFQIPLAHCNVQLLAGDVVVEFLLIELVLIFPLAGLIFIELLLQAVLILPLLQLLVPLGVGTVCLVLAVAGIDVVAGVQQSADHGTQTRGAAEGDLHRIAQYAQYSHHIVERLLAPCCLLLFLCAVVVVQRAQLVQVVLILSVVLRICIVVGFALLLQLGVVIRQPVPDDINVSAIFYGPVLLAANMGEVGQSDIGFSWPQEEIKDPAPDAYFPSLMGSRKALESWIIKKRVH